MNTLYYDRFDSPIGALTVAVDQVGVRHILFAENRHDAKGREHWQHDADFVAEPRRQLLEYLQGIMPNQRDSDVYDWIADLCGSIVGVLVASTHWFPLFFRLQRRKEL